jgi:hypothetical protein
MKLDINFEGLDIEGVKNCIKNKERKPFSVIYDFLDFQRNKVETIEKIAKLKTDENFFKKMKIGLDLDEKLVKIKALFINNKNMKQEDDTGFWRIGLICHKDCFYIMTEVLKSLQNNGYEWKIVSSSYKIKGRKKISSNGNCFRTETKNILNFLIQIFAVIEP